MTHEVNGATIAQMDGPERWEEMFDSFEIVVRLHVLGRAVLPSSQSGALDPSGEHHRTHLAWAHA